MQMYFVSPSISRSAKEDVAECLSQYLQQDLPSPIVELLDCVKQVATCTMLADRCGRGQIYSHLQKAVSRTKGMEELADTGPSLLHCAMAVVQYMNFYNSASTAEMADVLTTICDLLFPAILTEAASLQELVAIRADYDLQQISLSLLLDYGTVLLQCASTPDLAAELIFKLLGCQLPLNTCSTDTLVSEYISATFWCDCMHKINLPRLGYKYMYH